MTIALIAHDSKKELMVQFCCFAKVFFYSIAIIIHNA